MKLFSEETLAHYGLLGMKWGQRRWQKEDGTFNEEGKERYFGKPIFDKFINKSKKIEKKIKKDMTELMYNKDKYEEREYYDKLNKFNNEYNVYRNVLSNTNKSKNIFNRYGDKFQEKLIDKSTQEIVNFLYNEFTKSNN